MNKKLVFGVVLILVVILFAWGFSQYNPGKGDRAEVNSLTGNVIRGFSGNEAKVDYSKSSFEFEGYNPVRSHVGNFEKMNVYIGRDGNQIVSLSGEIFMDSVNTGIERLDNHLRSDDFFDVEKFPKIEFYSTDISGGIMTGVLKFRGVEKQIVVPVSVDENSIGSEFLLDTAPFNFKYVGVNREVRIKFNFVA